MSSGIVVCTTRSLDVPAITAAARYAEGCSPSTRTSTCGSLLGMPAKDHIVPRAGRPSMENPLAFWMLPKRILQRIQRFLEIALLAEADEFLLDLAVLEQNDGGDRADAVLDRHVAVGVGVELADLDLPAVIARQLLDGRREHPAGHAPLGPEIHQHRHLRLQHFLIEVLVAEFHHVLSHRVLLRDRSRYVAVLPFPCGRIIEVQKKRVNAGSARRRRRSPRRHRGTEARSRRRATPARKRIRMVGLSTR